MIHKVCALLLIVVSVVYATAETKDDATHRPKHHIKHGQQDFMTADGQHNVHFDHEGILGKAFIYQLKKKMCT